MFAAFGLMFIRLWLFDGSCCCLGFWLLVVYYLFVAVCGGLFDWFA